MGNSPGRPSRTAISASSGAGGSASARAVTREVLRLAGPAILTSFMQTLVFLADRLMLGRYDTEALASMQVQGPVMWSVFSIFMGALVGTVALVARCVGAGDLVRGQRVARVSVRVAAIIGTGVGLLGLLGVPLIVSTLGPPEEAIQALSRSYLRIGFVGMPFLFLATTSAMILQGSGDTRTPFLVGVVTNTVNIGLNAVLIHGVAALSIPELGVAGAATGTACAFALEATLLLLVLRRPDHPVRVHGAFLARRAERAAEWQALRDLFRISGPAIFDRLAVHAGFLAFVRIINLLGPTVMAANQALITVESICFLSADGFGVAAATVVGQQLGRGQERGAFRGGIISTALGAGTLTLFGLIIWATGPLTLGVFSPPDQDATAMVETGLLALPILALAQPFMGCGVVLAQALRGAGDTRSPFWSALFGSVFVRVGLAYALAVAGGLGIVGIWLASTADWVLRTSFLAAVFARGRWTKTRV